MSEYEPSKRHGNRGLQFGCEKCDYWHSMGIRACSCDCHDKKEASKTEEKVNDMGNPTYEMIP